ncbi:UDP-N-acetylmuramoyl-L-alanyl-D-glutamate--2,6-diaminopimelate ligase [Fictibacillus sp. 18YEL24]|uniref:UDP-N-acetylmuramoyl-L-alanyl-D-glutamate--2, 6-diaminopimelate ligase n=1 Tax=Fictibacillus sp. 18YEL24 TaxID=2745875 RepID=UPI0018CD4DF3|nr:UDP-N-acetylmuramoyl-L-alanyl-D-glutamate--2,6-diaminopimelate ligase [Fictibacillus sp. 18YEL24]MBH0170681.1 UDP-N-acetylmuramoyl-L-alanyl-D-glutamate--2,6-diaminopimelate ligase [Fictibacillus sp. 18YEL24]
MELKELLTYLVNYEMDIQANPEITSIEMDSRKAGKGCLFVCMEGLLFDGHDFAKTVANNGAAAILAEKDIDVNIPVIKVKNTKKALAVLADAFYGHPSQKLHLIGITGTNGKTTTSHLIEKVLRDAGKSTGMIGTIEMKIKDQSFKVANTTPDSLFLQNAFYQMTEEKVEAAVMEVSSHALVQGRVWGCDFDIAVFTNLTQDHLDYHKNMEEYQFAKSLLFSQMGNTYNRSDRKVAVLNNDDPASKMFERVTSAQVVSYGIDNDSDVRATDILIGSQGTTFKLQTPIGSREVTLKLIGKFSVYNVLAATTACLLSGLDLDQILASLKEVTGVSGRFEPVIAGQDFTVIVDYAHTPDSLENVLRTIKEFATGKITAIVGCGGDRDKTKRPLMAGIAANLADHAIFTSDNPRTEDPLQILKDMEEGVDDGNYVTIPDRKKAIEHAVEKARANDVILIAGKGHETYQIIGKDILEFDDRIVAREAIKAVKK